MHVVQSILNTGSNGQLIEIECQLSNGLPSIIIVGLGSKAIDEAKERIRSAFATTKLALPRKRITINLAPADIPKESTGFDLPIAAAILSASQQLKHQLSAHEALFGELGLDGNVRGVRGLIGKLLAGKERGLTTFYVPHANLQQALLVPGITIVPIRTIQELYLGLNDSAQLEKHKTDDNALRALVALQPAQADQLDEVVGQSQAKRALAIGAAGGHNILLSGPPGTGKSMLAKVLPSLLPAMSQDEVLEATNLHSLSSNDYDRLIAKRPFRSPHHSSSQVAIVGGGQPLRPGEVSLSHCGVLFLDEMAEFNRGTIEALRQPLEDRAITIARAKDSITFPAKFILVATTNPCPCGYYGTAKPCSCSAHTIASYMRKLSGPILDRIDLYVSVEDVKHEQLLEPSGNSKAGETLRQQIERARHAQRERYGPGKLNSDMTNTDIKRLARLLPAAKDLLDQAGHKLGISARAYMRTIKVARTIADIGQSPDINMSHISEALQYRRQTTLE